jgi:hypothetical protein
MCFRDSIPIASVSCNASIEGRCGLPHPTGKRPGTAQTFNVRYQAGSFNGRMSGPSLIQPIAPAGGG